jgi:hypothetical protein
VKSGLDWRTRQWSGCLTVSMILTGAPGSARLVDQIGAAQGRRCGVLAPIRAVAAGDCRPDARARWMGDRRRSAGGWQPPERGHQRVRPRPVMVEAQDDPAGVANEPGGGMPQAIAQRLGLGDFEVA